jgi:alpha-beta hydrolase superfamily lysophospholipase
MKLARTGALVLATALSLGALGPGEQLSPAAERVTLVTSDGVPIAGTLYHAPVRPAPAVVLLHMLHRSQSDWGQFAVRLADSGISALTIDFRGHGLSLRPQDVAEPAGHSALVLDVQAALDHLLARVLDVDSESIGLAGASLGGSVAVLTGAANPSVRSIAVLSPAVEYRGLRIDSAMRQYGERPALLAASLGDPYAHRSVRELAAQGAGQRERHSVDGMRHGTALLSDLTLQAALVDWFRRTLLL